MTQHSSGWQMKRRFRLVLRDTGQMREMGGGELSEAVLMVDNLFIKALEIGASDIHLQPEREQLKVRYRVDGVLHDTGQFPREIAENIVARIKLAANMAIDERREPQDGRIDMEFLERRLSSRVSVIPSLNGEKVVMRILDPGQMKVELDQLGMNQDVRTKWDQAIRAPYGLICVTGPTGSGKTSTLYASIARLDRTSRNIVTVEDPIEYEFDDHICQVQVTEKMPFPRVIRTFLRQDPDVMMVGEMRDPESLSIGIQAGLTGHLVLTTIHTNNAVETVQRMFDMGAEPYLVAGTLVAIMAQRLVRLNCPNCREKFTPPEDELLALGIQPEQAAQANFQRGRGCEQCRKTGYKGRTGVFEIIMATPEFKTAVATGGSAGELNAAARRQGMRTMMEDGLQKILSGETTPDEVLRAVYTGAVEA
jgi:type II secretory ATPase GspE/PulE/Tfp pilus assembly ATPase PilB-like protein